MDHCIDCGLYDLVLDRLFNMVGIRLLRAGGCLGQVFEHYCCTHDLVHFVDVSNPLAVLAQGSQLQEFVPKKRIGFEP